MTRTGLPHSEMYGSLPACGSPYLFAAYRVLHRLSMPRHPPYALCSLITFRNFTFKVNHTMIMLSVFVKVCYPKMSFLPLIRFCLHTIFRFGKIFIFLFLCSFQCT